MIHSNAPSLRTLRIIVTGVIAGLCVIGGAVLFSASRIGARVIVDPLLPMAAAGIALSALLIQAFAVPRLFRIARQECQDDSARLRVYGLEVFTRVGILAAAALLQDVAYLFTLDAIVLAAGAALVVVMAWQRPSPTSFHRWCRS